MAEQQVVTLPELFAGPVPLSAREAAALALNVVPCASDYGNGMFPALDRVGIRGDRVFIIHGTSISAANSGVQWVGEALSALLSHVARHPGQNVPVGLKTIVARATGLTCGEPANPPIDITAFPPLSTTTELIEALRRFLPRNPAASVQRVFDRATGILAAASGAEGAGCVERAVASGDVEPVDVVRCDERVEMRATDRAPKARTFDDLRHRREGASVSLESVANATKIPIALLESLERGDLSRWPRGLYARAHLTAYARHAGIPPDEVIAVALGEAERTEVATPHESPSSLRSSRKMSALTPMLLVIAALGMFAFGRTVVRYTSSADSGPDAHLDTPAATPQTQTKRPSGIVTGSSIPAAAPPAINAPAPATAPTPQIANNMSGDVTRDRAEAAAAVAALRAQRSKLAAALEEENTALAGVEQERQAVQTELDTAQSDEDAAAFRKRLDELSQQVDTLTKAKARIEGDLRGVDRKLKTASPR